RNPTGNRFDHDTLVECPEKGPTLAVMEKSGYARSRRQTQRPRCPLSGVERTWSRAGLGRPVLTPTGHRPARSASTILPRFAPSRMEVWPDKMALLTLGGGYGAATENGRQDGGENAQGKLSKGPQPRQDQAPRCSNHHSIESFVGFGSWQGVEGGPRAAGGDSRNIEGHLQFGLRRPAGVRCRSRQRQQADRRLLDRSVPVCRRHLSP